MRYTSSEYISGKTFYPVWAVSEATGVSCVNNFYFDNELEAMVYWYSRSHVPDVVLYVFTKESGSWQDITPRDHP